jgi:CubicO group peptidase (beta-lactamase class C family)
MTMLALLSLYASMALTPAGCGAAIHDRLDALRQENGASAVAFIYETQGGEPIAGYIGRNGHDEAALEAGPDSIFRIYSMTRPVTSVAIMVLVEQGLVDLDAPVETYLPAMARPEVLTRLDGDLTQAPRAPAESPVTVRHLLTHTSGYGFGTTIAGPSPLAPLYDPVGVQSHGGPRDLERLLAQVPLAFEPGQGWAYGMSTDVLGRIIEVVTGEELGDALNRLVFAPLGMTGTAFTIDPSRAPHLVQPPLDDGSDYFDPLQTGERQSGGMGLVSTLPDYARFARMLLQRGELDGVRILAAEAVDMMTRNQLSDELMQSRWARGPGFLPGRGHGFGLGVRVNLAEEPSPDAGAYGWGGVGGTDFFVAPATGSFAVLMVQDIANRHHYRGAFRAALTACARP